MRRTSPFTSFESISRSCSVTGLVADGKRPSTSTCQVWIPWQMSGLLYRSCNVQLTTSVIRSSARSSLHSYRIKWSTCEAAAVACRSSTISRIGSSMWTPSLLVELSPVSKTHSTSNTLLSRWETSTTFLAYELVYVKHVQVYAKFFSLQSQPW